MDKDLVGRSACSSHPRQVDETILAPWGSYIFFFLSFFLFFFGRFKATPTAYGGSWARGRIGAVAASLCHSHSNARFEPRLRPTPQLMALPVP